MSRRRLRAALSAAERALEAFHDGDGELAMLIVENLAFDIENALARAPGLSCPICSVVFDFPGQLDQHTYRIHGDELSRSRAA